MNEQDKPPVPDSISYQATIPEQLQSGMPVRPDIPTSAKKKSTGTSRRSVLRFASSVFVGASINAIRKSINSGVYPWELLQLFQDENFNLPPQYRENSKQYMEYMKDILKKEEIEFSDLSVANYFRTKPQIRNKFGNDFLRTYGTKTESLSAKRILKGNYLYRIFQNIAIDFVAIPSTPPNLSIAIASKTAPSGYSTIEPDFAYSVHINKATDSFGEVVKKGNYTLVGVPLIIDISPDFFKNDKTEFYYTQSEFTQPFRVVAAYPRPGRIFYNDFNLGQRKIPRKT